MSRENETLKTLTPVSTIWKERISLKSQSLIDFDEF
jgi:hypothetical protein